MLRTLLGQRRREPILVSAGLKATTAAGGQALPNAAVARRDIDNSPIHWTVGGPSGEVLADDGRRLWGKPGTKCGHLRIGGGRRAQLAATVWAARREDVVHRQ